MDKGVLGYSSVNYGFTLLYMVVASFLMYFYTDVLAISAGAVTVILFLARFFDGAIDPFIGYYMDSHTTKHGKYRGYIYYWGLPSCVLFVLLFTYPPFAGFMAVAWCLLIYLFWSFSFSMIEVANLPLLALISQAGARNLTNTLKITASILAALTASYLTFKLVNFFGKGSEQTGFFITSIIFACIALVACFSGAKNITEKNATSERTLPFTQTMATVFTNRRLVYLYLMLICDQVTMSARIQSALYYLKYYLKMPGIIPIFFMVNILSSLGAQPIILWASKRTRISSLIIWGYVTACAGIISIWLAGPSVSMILVGNAIYGICYAFPANLVYVYASELSDQLSAEHRSNFCAVINSLLQVSSKIGYTIAGSAVAFVLYMTSYAPNVEQSAVSLLGIQICFLGLTSVILLVSAFFAYLSFCGTGEKLLPVEAERMV